MRFQEGDKTEEGLVITWRYGPCQAVYRCSCGMEVRAEYKAICRGLRILEAEMVGWKRQHHSWICPRCNRRSYARAHS